MKVSIVTVCKNAAAFIETCIQSVQAQTYPDIEHIIIDGESEDGTLSIIHKYRDHIDGLISEKDRGIYDAMNKGIAIARGDIIGILNADDLLASEKTIESVVRRFKETEADAVYGDLWYVDRQDISKVSRKWRAGKYRKGLFQWGWMPPHPTFYVKRSLFEQWGNYNLEFGSAADYELMLRFLHQYQANVAYLPELIVKMRTGGISNYSLKNRIQANRADLKAMRHHKISLPELAILLKPLRKIHQFINS